MDQIARPSAEEAYEIFLALGSGRTLPRLAAAIRECGNRVPSMTTLKRWSTRDEWFARAKEYDQQLAREVAARAREQLIAERVQGVAQAETAMVGTLRRIEVLAPQIEDPAQLPMLADVACKLGQHVLDMKRGQTAGSGSLARATAGLERDVAAGKHTPVGEELADEISRLVNVGPEKDKPN